jgi:hypothetical protein
VQDGSHFAAQHASIAAPLEDVEPLELESLLLLEHAATNPTAAPAALVRERRWKRRML